ncbi:PREDICTED: 26S proteasome non-ATPase regulatory subunit 5 [Nanorana parkeri]|uniref:26S proteasome non-ATPase regulatory subunit 5 n=1 Tax=Nanorana parkeri TaxID=125878 RepID=UPI0008545908|nr:PREDICTED: 26S proteasome non-ATPase regulatory subunit 5 [Nanorana parkeri]
MAASIEQLLSSLSNLEDPIEGLRSLKTAALTLPLSTLTERLPAIRLDAVFRLMASQNREQVDLCVAILERFLQALEPIYIAQNYKEDLQRGLYHPDDSVKLLAISQAGRIVECSEAITEILNNLELLKQIIMCIGGDKIAVAKEAIKSLSKIARTTVGLDVLFGSNLLASLKAVSAFSDVVRYRVYELMVEISSVSAESLNFCANSGILSQLLDELTGDDVLARVACTEMVTALAATLHGRQYLAQEGLIDRISNMILGADSDSFSGLYLPGLVKFFGNLAVLDSPQQICEHYPAFLRKVFEMVEGHETSMIGVAVDTLGILGSTVEGKQVLQKTGTRFNNVFKRIGHHARNAPTELRVRSLDSISSLLFLPEDHHTEDLLAMSESWFVCLSNQPMDLFRSIATQPFPELHCAGLKVFTAIANQPWAQKLMIESPGFIEYIVDRTVDPDKDSKDAKFDLVKALVKSKTIAEVFGNQHYLRLRAYLREGAYYVKAISTVAVEGAE